MGVLIRLPDQAAARNDKILLDHHACRLVDESVFVVQMRGPDEKLLVSLASRFKRHHLYL